MLSILGEAALRTALLAGILQVTLSVLRVRRARLLLAAWTSVLAISLAMPILLRSNPWQIPLDDAVPRALIDSATEFMPQPSMIEPAGPVSVETTARPSIETWLAAAYLVVGGFLGLRVLLGVGLSLRILARASRSYPEWAAGLRVRLSRDVAGPVTIARTIVLPTDFVAWPAETRQAVLAHEHAHVARLDYAMLVVSQVNRAVFWFSPLSWWLHHRLAVLTELVCDDRAIEVTRDHVGYAEILLAMAQRSVPTARGPSMARFSTLPLRIDRILLDQIERHGVSRLHWTTLTLGLAAVSLAVANVAPSIVWKPVTTDTPIDSAIGAIEIEKPAPDLSRSNLPFPGKPLEPIPNNVAAAIPRTQPAKPAARLHPVVQVPTKSALVLPTAKPDQVMRLPPTVPGREASPAPDVVDQKRAGVAAEDPRTTVPAKGASLSARNETLYPRETANDPLRANVDRLDGSTCTGTIAVGARAYYSGGGFLEPGVTAGQIVPASAQFFRKADGTSWVRFGSFQRPPLDVRVQPTRTGVTWTGEYGISYAVQDAGNGRFIGLAAKIGNDSATLSFNCRK